MSRIRNNYSVGIIEVVFNPNGHTYWVEGIVDDREIKFHHTTTSNECWSLDEAIEAEVKKVNKDYHTKLVDVSYGYKNFYLYEVIWL